MNVAYLLGWKDFWKPLFRSFTDGNDHANGGNGSKANSSLISTLPTTIPKELATYQRLNGVVSDIDLHCSVGARCDEDGNLIVEIPLATRIWAAGWIIPFNAWTVFSFPGFNMHAYDYNYFFNNIRKNGDRRVEAWARARKSG